MATVVFEGLRRSICTMVVGAVVACGCAGTGPDATTVRVGTVGTGPIAESAAAASTIATSVADRPADAPASRVPVADATIGIRSVDFENFVHEFSAGELGAFVDGAFVQGSPADEGYVSAQIQSVVVGDLDDDGVEEAAVGVSYDRGGSGLWTDVLVYRWNGTTATFAVRAGAGDRAENGVFDFDITGGLLVVERFYGLGGLCCPEQVVRESFRLVRDVLDPVAGTFRRVYVSLGAAPEDLRLSFQDGATGARFVGEVASGHRVTFLANAGQVLELTVLDGPTNALTRIEVLQGSSSLGTASTGVSLRLELPLSAEYTLVIRTQREGDARASFDAELSIT